MRRNIISSHFSEILLIALLLANCNSPRPTPTSTLAAPVLQVTSQPEPSPPPPTQDPPPPTPPPHRVGVIAPGGDAGDYSPPALVLEALQFFKSQYGWTVESGDLPDLERLAASGAQIVVTVNTGLSVQNVAARHPEVEFVVVDEAELEDLPNILAIGGETSREDQAGFIAGVLAGLATQELSVGVLADPTDPIGRMYLNGFIHGVRYSCPDCTITDQAISESQVREEAQAAARELFNRVSLDVAFAQPGQAGEAALHWLAQQQIWVIGAGGDIFLRSFKTGALPGSDRVLTSVVFRPDLALLDVLPALAAGQPVEGPIPYTLTSGLIAFAPSRVDLLSPAGHTFLDRALSLVASGELDTGVDPITGEER